MRKKLFGNNISASCDYCSYLEVIDEKKCCIKDKDFEKGSCKLFKYDPLKRVPRAKPILPRYAIDDFTL